MIAMLQAVRALMIVGIVLGAFGLLVATFSLKCLRMGNMEDSAKASMTLAAGVMCIVSGELEFPLSSKMLSVFKEVFEIKKW